MNLSETADNGFVAGTSSDRASRRVFLSAAGLAGTAYAAAIAYPVYRFLASPIEQASANAAVTEVSLKNAQKMASGSVLMFKFGTAPAMLIHHKDGTCVALGAVCTHLGCTVQYLPADNRIHCFCHGGEYDPSTGANIGGPPPKPLKRFVVTITDEAAVISRA